jgi:hypothetical protein
MDARIRASPGRKHGSREVRHQGAVLLGDRQEDRMNQSWGKAAGGLIGGALLGGAIAVILAIVGYTLYWRGGLENMGDRVIPGLNIGVEMIPIFLVLGSLGAMLGGAAGVARALSWIPTRDEPRSGSSPAR